MMQSISKPSEPSSPQRLPPLQHGDRLTSEEFMRRWEVMPHLKKAELLHGMVYIAAEVESRLIDPRIPPLENGDRLSFEEFQRRWANMPDLKKAELLRGEVFLPPPVSAGSHGMPDFTLSMWLGNYQLQTLGVLGANNSTLILGADIDPQPDGVLFLQQRAGGKSYLDSEGYIHGSPELVVEVAASSVAYDLNLKLEIYQEAGISEYLVYQTYDPRIDWFILRDGKYQGLAANSDGLLKSIQFPGLWLDPEAMLRRDMSRVISVLQAGLASPEHAAFVKKLTEMLGG
jgi:Uma2 family endonuclease